MRVLDNRIAAVAAVGVLAVFSVLTLGCGGDKGTGPGVGSIAGTVYRAGSADPVYGALVVCAGVSDTTDARGAYTLEQVPVGTHTLTATKTNYEVFSATVKVTGHTEQNIFIAYKGGGGGDIGE